MTFSILKTLAVVSAINSVDAASHKASFSRNSAGPAPRAPAVMDNCSWDLREGCGLVADWRASLLDTDIYMLDDGFVYFKERGVKVTKLNTWKCPARSLHVAFEHATPLTINPSFRGYKRVDVICAGNFEVKEEGKYTFKTTREQTITLGFRNNSAGNGKLTELKDDFWQYIHAAMEEEENPTPERRERIEIGQIDWCGDCRACSEDPCGDSCCCVSCGIFTGIVGIGGVIGALVWSNDMNQFDYDDYE